MGLVTYTTPAALTTFGFTVLGLASIASAYKPYPIDPTEPTYCDAPGSMQGQVHPRETRLEQLVSPSFYERWFGNPENPKDYLTFDSKDLREKFLFLSADEDQNGLLEPQNVLNLLKDINKKYDLKFRVVKSVDDVCREVKEASQQGKLSNVFIDAHSDSLGMCLSNCNSQQGWLHKFRDYKECFKGMDPNGKISNNFDLKFKVVKSYDEICKEILAASKIGEIVHLVIDGHGERKGIQISDQDWMFLYPGRPDYRNFECFKQLGPSTKITLLTCSTGKPNDHGNLNDNMANLIAKKTGKVVISPTDLMKATKVKIESIDNFDVFHPDPKDKKENLFKKFNPERE